MQTLKVFSCLLAIITVASTNSDLYVAFHLHTRTTGAEYQQLYIDDVETLEKSLFDASKKTFIVTHGWQNSCESDSVVTIRDALLENDDYNVVAVDWSVKARESYIVASAEVSVVAGYIAEMIDFLEGQGLDTSKLTIVGHSLGAHIAGMSGYLANSTVGFVVGLDPAGPLFSDANSTSRISTVDADVVHVIHTNAGLLGISFAVGHADFWPNGGSDQPGCSTTDYGASSHGRAYEYFAESLNSGTGFQATDCASYDLYNAGDCSGNDVRLMGGSFLDKSASGLYYLNTSSTSPYALGK